MKLNLKNICLCSLVVLGGIGMTSCESWLDREPITDVTPGAYFKTAEQVANYVNNYYTGSLVNSRGQNLFHNGNYGHLLGSNDDNTDNYVSGRSGSLDYFAGEWQAGTGQALSSRYAWVRVWNYLINLVEETRGEISGSSSDIDHYLGEAYFFRAMIYYNALVSYGDLPIVTEVLPDDNAVLVAHSARSPRNEVARFILKDLDTAIGLLYSRAESPWKVQRLNEECAYLFKSRVALFEATFEKYHKGSGRVPGDSNWPGAAMSYNAGKSFDIDAEIKFFLTEAKAAAKVVADAVALTPNNHVMNPEPGQISGWNPYFEMFSQASMPTDGEVLLYRSYDKTTENIGHNAIRRVQTGNGDGLTHSFTTDFLTADGLPIYAAGVAVDDSSIMSEKKNRDERFQLFVLGEEDILKNDAADIDVAEAMEKGEAVLFGIPLITCTEETSDATGYRSRKYGAFDFNQCLDDHIHGTNACPVFRAAEAYLNYIEASYELDGTVATSYWQQLRARAGVDTDIDKTIAATDLQKELDLQHLAAYGITDKTLYNIRRERRCELIAEGFRWDDLKRWRSWDYCLAKPYIVEGVNLWDAMWKLFPQNAEEEEGTSNRMLKDDGSTDANVSPKSDSKYLRPMRRTATNNQLYDGYTWMKAYYLSPLGTQDLTTAVTDPDDETSTVMYQNPYWPNGAGLALE